MLSFSPPDDWKANLGLSVCVLLNRWTGSSPEEDLHQMGEQAPDEGKYGMLFTDVGLLANQSYLSYIFVGPEV